MAKEELTSLRVGEFKSWDHADIVHQCGCVFVGAVPIYWDRRSALPEMGGSMALAPKVTLVDPDSLGPNAAKALVLLVRRTGGGNHSVR